MNGSLRAVRPGLGGYLLVGMLLLLCTGCGTTKWSDTARTGTEQLLLSTAIDRAINEINFKPIAGKDVYFDQQFLEGITDKNYVISSLRQHLLASGCVLKADRKDAMLIVEARAGAVGTNRHEVMLGVPSVNVPTVLGLAGVPPTIPEIPLAKTTDQKGIAKIAVFAYNQQTGLPVWQSGAFPVVSNAKDTWFFGTGPFSRGSIYDGTRFAGSRILLPFGRKKTPIVGNQPDIPVTAEAVFDERPVLVQKGTNETASAEPQKLPESAGTPVALTPEASPEVKPDGPSAAGPRPEDKGVVAAGHIVRLPPTEQAARPDLLDPPAATTGKTEPRAAGGARDDESDVIHANGLFHLFRPRSWFED